MEGTFIRLHFKVVGETDSTEMRGSRMSQEIAQGKDCHSFPPPPLKKKKREKIFFNVHIHVDDD